MNLPDILEQVAAGKITWESGRIFRERCVGSPVAAPGLAMGADGYGSHGLRIVAVRPDVKDKHGKAAVAYQIKRPVPLVPTPLVKDGRLFAWEDHGSVGCYDVATGKRIWREQVGGKFYGSPVWVNKHLYCMSRTGDVYVLAASDTFKLVARVPLGEPSFATPAVADGVMYLRTRSQLFSLGGKKP